MSMCSKRGNNHMKLKHAIVSRRATSAFVLTVLMPMQGFAQTNSSTSMEGSNILFVSALIGALIVAILSAVYFYRTKTKAELDRARMAERLYEQRIATERAETLIAADDQRLVIWENETARPYFAGFLPEAARVPDDQPTFLAFGKWLEPTSAMDLDQSARRLRQDGVPFELTIVTKADTHLEVCGRVTGDLAFLRFRSLSGARGDLAKLQDAHSALVDNFSTLKSLLGSMPQPVWLRDARGKLTWVNKAYREAIASHDLGGKSSPEKNNIVEFLGADEIDLIKKAHLQSQMFTNRLPVIMDGKRHIFDVVDVACPESHGISAASAGIATDVTEAERTRSTFQRTLNSHQKTLNVLATAIAIFNDDCKLVFYNDAYQKLFGLDTTFLATQPEEGLILDRLRDMRKVPEEADYRRWKNKMLGAQRSVEASEFNWHLPDGQSLRVVASPHMEGGMTWIYEDRTEELDLKSQVSALDKLQSETLNQLSDGVAVFSSNGHVALANNSFSHLWNLQADWLVQAPHINEIFQACEVLHKNREDWDTLRANITGVLDRREAIEGRMEREDNRVVDYITKPLLNGQTLVTFVEVTASVALERSLLDRNENLLEVDKLRTDFVQHMNYELRAPLTNIIGFAQLLSEPDLGVMNDKQSEYVNYILSSSSSLLAIINDILDLATADAGLLKLELGRVDIGKVIEAAITGLKDRIEERKIDLLHKLEDDLPTLVGDEKRLRQIIFNLLSNAIHFSHPGGRVEIRARAKGNTILVDVEDWGVGIAPELQTRVFERFETHSKDDGTKNGTGLGLSIVKRFVELHNGSITLASAEGKGTCITCHFPMKQVETTLAAE